MLIRASSVPNSKEYYDKNKNDNPYSIRQINWKITGFYSFRLTNLYKDYIKPQKTR